jgi:hypothetical protein
MRASGERRDGSDLGARERRRRETGRWWSGAGPIGHAIVIDAEVVQRDVVKW